jgi:hypothetical protein
MATRDDARMYQPIRCGCLPMGCLHQSATPLKVFAKLEGDGQLAQKPYMKPSSADELAANADDSRQDVECA